MLFQKFYHKFVEQRTLYKHRALWAQFLAAEAFDAFLSVDHRRSAFHAYGFRRTAPRARMAAMRSARAIPPLTRTSWLRRWPWRMWAMCPARCAPSLARISCSMPRMCSRAPWAWMLSGMGWRRPCWRPSRMRPTPRRWRPGPRRPR